MGIVLTFNALNRSSCGFLLAFNFGRSKYHGAVIATPLLQKVFVAWFYIA